MKRNILDVKKTILSLMSWDNKACVAVVGVTEHRLGVGEVWLLPSVLVDKTKLNFFKAVKLIVDELALKILKFRRLDLAVMEGDLQGYKWAEKLGFKQQALIEAYDEYYNNAMMFYKVDKWL